MVESNKRLNCLKISLVIILFYILLIPSWGAAYRGHLRVGVLKHSMYGSAEVSIREECYKLGIEFVLIDPFKIRLSLGSDEEIDKDIDVDVLIARCEINRGEDPEVMAYQRLLQIFNERNIPVINSWDSIITSQDKYLSHVIFVKHGLASPSTFLTYNIKSAREIITSGKLSFPIIVKEVYGGRGDGVFKVDSLEELAKLYDKVFARYKRAFMLQEMLELEKNEEGQVRDMRVWVIRDLKTNRPKAVGGIYRNARNNVFKTNTLSSSYVKPIEKEAKEEFRLAELAMDVTGGDVAGVDVARTVDGKLYVLEINNSFETGPVTRKYIGVNIWEEVIKLALHRIPVRKKIARHKFIPDRTNEDEEIKNIDGEEDTQVFSDFIFKLAKLKNWGEKVKRAVRLTLKLIELDDPDDIYALEGVKKINDAIDKYNSLHVSWPRTRLSKDTFEKMKQAYEEINDK